MRQDTRDYLDHLNGPMAGWRPTTWLAAVAASAAGTVVTLAAVVVVVVAFAGVCDSPSEHLVAGRLWLAALVVTTALPWALAARRSPYPIRVACFALLPMAMPVLALVDVMTTSAGDWNWCLF